MSVWWPVLAAFWLWYLIDGVRVTRRARFSIRSWRGGRAGSVQHLPITWPPFSPVAWQRSVEEMPFSLSPEGLCNLPVAALGRPAPYPTHVRAWSWEEVHACVMRRGFVEINGLRFCHAGNLSWAPALRDLVKRCQGAAPAERGQILQNFLREWFRPTHLRRRHHVLRLRTRTLALTNLFGTVTALAITVALLGTAAGAIDAESAERLARFLPHAALLFGFFHVFALIETWLAHRKLLPEAKDERVQLVLGGVLLPPHALRLRARLSAESTLPAHPLAWMAATASEHDFRVFARQCVTDLLWPVASPSGQYAAAAQRITAWFGRELGARIDDLLAFRGVSKAELLAAPAPDGASSRQYCPRCGAQFTEAAKRCPQGIPLQRLQR